MSDAIQVGDNDDKQRLIEFLRATIPAVDHYDSFGNPCQPDCGVTHG